MDQSGFDFGEGALTALPVSQLLPEPEAPTSKPGIGSNEEKEEFRTLVRKALVEMSALEVLLTDDVLRHMGINPVAMSAWQRSRILEVFGEPVSRYKAYCFELLDGKASRVEFRRVR